MKQKIGFIGLGLIGGSIAKPSASTILITKLWLSIKIKKPLPLQPRNLSSMLQQPRLTIISIIVTIYSCAHLLHLILLISNN